MSLDDGVETGIHLTASAKQRQNSQIMEKHTN